MAGCWVLAGAVTPAAADNIRGQQWWLQALGVPAAHAISQGDGVTVAVLDSGAAANQPDLVGNVVPGVDILTNKGDATDDPNGHGTGMAAIIAGHGHGPGNADGVLGIAPKAKILPIRITGAESHGITGAEFATAVDAAVARGATVISASIEITGDATASQAILRAVDKGVAIVASTGNGTGIALQVQSAPARYPGVIAVGGSDRRGNYAGFSVEGSDSSSLMLIAPAVDGINANPDGTYATGKSGTSMSSAIVAGAVALMRSKDPNLPVYEIWNRLRATAVDKGPPGFDTKTGYGLLDLGAALTRQIEPTPSPTPFVKRSATPSAGPAAKATTAAPSAAAASPGGGASTPALVISAVAAAVTLGAVLLLARRRRG
jgi:subtilisin family serine protease